MKIRLALVMTAAFLAPAAVRAQSYSELLQRAIYLQETRGDLEGAVRRCVTTLRAKIEPDPHCPIYIHTFCDVGYKFEPAPGDGT